MTADPGTVLALVLAGHLVGDWLVQTDRQAAGKTWPRPSDELGAAVLTAGLNPRAMARRRIEGEGLSPLEVKTVLQVRRRLWWRSVRANQAHVLGYHLAMLAGVAFSGLDATPVAVLLSISWVTHSFIDRRWPVRWLMRHTGSAAFAETSWGVMAVDQALHLSVLCVLVAALAQ